MPKLVFYIVLPLAIVGFFISPLRGKICISEFQLSDPQQQIDAALDYYVEYLARKHDFQDPVPPRKIFRQISPPFSTVTDFKARFPDCCKIVSFSDSEFLPPGWFEWSIGDVGSHVKIDFSVPYFGDNGVPLEIAHQQVIPVSPCGSIRADVPRYPIGGM